MSRAPDIAPQVGKAEGKNPVEEARADNSAVKDNIPADAVAAELAERVKNAPKTTGERIYDWLQFWVGKAAILVATAAIAYVARYGKDKYGPVPNYLRRFQQWTNNKLLTNKVVPLEKHGEFGKRLAGAVSNTVLLVHGGNAFAPIMLELENNHEAIATGVDKRWGKPGEAEISHERLKDKPKQNWGDVIKGRFAAWWLIFGSFMVADTIIGQDKHGEYRFDKYEKGFGKFVANLTRSGREIAKMPAGAARNKAYAAHPMSRLGEILALDIYATTAAIFLWTAIARSSAKKRQEQKESPAEEAALLGIPLPMTAVADGSVQTAAPEEQKSHTAAIKPNAKTASAIKKNMPDPLYTGKLSQQQAQEASSPQPGMA